MNACCFCTLSCNTTLNLRGSFLRLFTLFVFLFFPFCLNLPSYPVYPTCVGLGGFIQSDCTVNWMSSSSPLLASTGLYSQVETVGIFFFCFSFVFLLFSFEAPAAAASRDEGELPDPSLWLYIYIGSVLSIEPFQFPLKLWKVWVCLLCSCMQEKEKKRYILSIWRWMLLSQ